MPKQNEGRDRQAIQPGCTVDIILKEDQRSGKKTRGIVQEILTNSLSHPHGIKVRLRDGRVGRIAEIVKSEGT
ncbi:MAG: YwbE family protein [Methanoregula sp.]|nr:YwbE family protein [Methanoregula sp.]